MMRDNFAPDFKVGVTFGEATFPLDADTVTPYACEDDYHIVGDRNVAPRQLVNASITFMHTSVRLSSEYSEE